MRRTKIIIMLATASLVTTGTLTLATGQDQTQERGYIGVRLDPNPLSSLLAKHLNVAVEAGILIYNVQVDSPADKAGLEKDDIIVGFQGEKIKSYDEFIAQVQKNKPGADVSLEIIHEGQRKYVELTLAALTEESQEWKYPFVEEPETRVPGRVFWLDPQQQDWQRIWPEDLPESVTRLFQEVRTVRIQDDEFDLEITIEGDPRSDDTKIIIKDFDEEPEKILETTPDKIDKLPEKYRRIVEKTLQNTENSWNIEYYFNLPENLRDRWGIPDWDTYRDRLQREYNRRLPLQEDIFRNLPRLIPEYRQDFERNLDDFEQRLQRQMRQMQELQEKLMQQMMERLKQLEERQQEILKKIRQEPEPMMT